MQDESDDRVGYGRPPKQTQFRPGQSGNPSGRPKGARNFRTELLEELAEPITIKDGDCVVTVSKQRACIKTLVAAAIGGNARACAALFALCAKKASILKTIIGSLRQTIVKSSTHLPRVRADGAARVNNRSGGIMKTIFNAALRKDLYSFVQKAFLESHGQRLGDQSYIEYLCHELSKIRSRQVRFFVINLPPQHLKTFCTSCLIAWYLGHHPKHRVLVIGYTAEHAESISRRVRNMMRSEWYQDAFQTRISTSRSSASNFETIAGGGIYAVSANGSVTGRPADLIVYDDPVQITDCNNLELLEKVNRQFDSLIMSRLSNPAKGCVVIVAHRLNENDISGHVLQQGGFRHTCLPAVAPRKKRFEMDDQTWLRRKGDPLRPDQYPKKVIARLRKSVLVPDFETLYQQNPGGSSSIRIKPEHFHFRDLHRMPEQPTILSVDPGGVSMHCDKSYSVIQLWIPLAAGDHLLWDQFRAQCGLDELWQAFKHLARRTPSAILIENTANGPALIERAKHFGR